MKAAPIPEWSPCEHEQGLARAFIAPAKRERIEELLGIPRRRATVLATLYHFRDLDSRCVHPIPSAQQSAEGVASILRRLGAPAICYVISTMRDLDARLLPLEEALAAVHGMGQGTILSCVPGKLGYFEGEDPIDRAVLRLPTDRALRR